LKAPRDAGLEGSESDNDDAIVDPGAKRERER
jgi:hypothetical protein